MLANTRLLSIESKTMKVVFVFVFVVDIVVAFVGVVYVVGLAVVGHKNLNLKFAQNQINNNK